MKYPIKNLFALTLLLTLAFTSTQAASKDKGIYKKTTETSDFQSVYKRVYDSMEKNRFFVIEELNVGEFIGRFKERWGDDYNRNQLEEFRIMIVCNSWYANQVSNHDTDLLALCPMRVTLLHKQEMTTILFARPTVFAKDSKALPVIQEIEETIINAIEDAVK
ncbi:MAG: DUF302 domain-containing protein [Gammaproteobacteria bacterium]|nr:MAG: DUF302 domain-containing protein [Gammaproteobacteria bacterium]